LFVNITLLIVRTIPLQTNRLNMDIIDLRDKDQAETGKGFYDTLKSYANESANDKLAKEKAEKSAEEKDVK